jgi:hypothetical protein
VLRGVEIKAGAGRYFCAIQAHYSSTRA